MWQNSLVFVAEKDSSGLTELGPTIFQSNTRCSDHPSRFCPDAYNGKSLLWYKPWKSDVSHIAVLLTGTAHSGTCRAWQPATSAPCKSIRSAHEREGGGCRRERKVGVMKRCTRVLQLIKRRCARPNYFYHWQQSLSGDVSVDLGVSEKIEGTSAALLAMRRDKPSNLNIRTIFELHSLKVFIPRFCWFWRQLPSRRTWA